MHCPELHSSWAFRGPIPAALSHLGATALQCICSFIQQTSTSTVFTLSPALRTQLSDWGTGRQTDWENRASFFEEACIHITARKHEKEDRSPSSHSPVFPQNGVHYD